MGRLALMILAVVLLSPPAFAACLMSYCRDNATASTPSRSYITNTHLQRIGDIYNPGGGRRIQIRNNARQIIGYIEPDGSITNKHRQKILNVEGLAD